VHRRRPLMLRPPSRSPPPTMRKARPIVAAAPELESIRVNARTRRASNRPMTSLKPRASLTPRCGATRSPRRIGKARSAGWSRLTTSRWTFLSDSAVSCGTHAKHFCVPRISSRNQRNRYFGEFLSKNRIWAWLIRRTGYTISCRHIGVFPKALLPGVPSRRFARPARHL
jgi:hypothetical protein